MVNNVNYAGGTTFSYNGPTRSDQENTPMHHLEPNPKSPSPRSNSGSSSGDSDPSRATPSDEDMTFNIDRFYRSIYGDRMDPPDTPPSVSIASSQASSSESIYVYPINPQSASGSVESFETGSFQSFETGSVESFENGMPPSSPTIANSRASASEPISVHPIRPEPPMPPDSDSD